MARRSAQLRHVLLVAVVAACAALLAPAGALADGDPASDMLLVQSVFYPYQPPVSGTLQRALNAETAAAAKAGLPIKVALISSPADLGAIPQLYGKPQAYADFLDKEISFNGPVPLLVVMGAGYGVQGFHTDVAGAASGLRPPTGKGGNALAQSALSAVAKLADATGHPIRQAAGVGAASGGAGPPTAIIVAVLVVVAVAAAAFVIRLRRRQAAAGTAR